MMSMAASPAAIRMQQDIQRKTGDNVDQIKDTKRDKVMTFSYDMSQDTGYEKPTYKGTGNGLGGDDLKDEYDVIVIGSGMGGLACGSLSAEYGSSVAVLESHIKPGGSAHTFSRMHNGGKYSFEVGPSIFEGLNGPSLNPLRTILDMLGEDLKCNTYTGLGYWTPEGYWRFPIGSAQKFEDLIYERCGKEEGDKAVEEWAALRKRLKTLGGSTTAVSLVNLRQDAGMIATTAGATPYVLTHPDVFLDLPLTFDSLHKTVDQIITVPFLRNYIDTMCIFCGFPAKGAMTAHILYILERFFEDGCAFCVPLGGTVEMAYAFQRALEKRDGELALNTHVQELLYDKEKERCTGVKLKNGKVIKAKKAVVSNATPFDTVKMLPDGGDAPELPEGVRDWKKTLGKLPRHGAIMHLFLAIDATDRGLAAEVITTRYDTRSKTRSTSPEERAILKAPSTYVVSKTPASPAMPGSGSAAIVLGASPTRVPSTSIPSRLARIRSPSTVAACLRTSELRVPGASSVQADRHPSSSRLTVMTLSRHSSLFSRRMSW